jgi:hypothetical protein
MEGDALLPVFAYPAANTYEQTGTPEVPTYLLKGRRHGDRLQNPWQAQTEEVHRVKTSPEKDQSQPEILRDYEQHPLVELVDRVPHTRDSSSEKRYCQQNLESGFSCSKFAVG